MEKKIENPKIFISYAWSGKDYEQKVLEFASKLKSDGIEVILDKWLMKPGSDTIDFMEQCVKDPSVNFVLMLLDKTYTEKANGRKGGVGIETQIISAQVYKDVSQEKFIPIIFDRDEDGTIYVPVYLNTRYYFDMTVENRDEEYVKLVKTLYGRPMYYEPALGAKPQWVDEKDNKISNVKFSLNMNKNEEETLTELFEQIKDFNCDYRPSGKLDKEMAEKILTYNNSFIPLRDIFIDIIKNSFKNDNFIDNVCDFYDKVKTIKGSSLKEEIIGNFVHESFIYLIAILYKNRRYKEINILITKTYFMKYGLSSTTNSNHYFYRRSYDTIDKAKNVKDDKNYYSGLAHTWIETLNVNAVNKDEFIFSDLLIHNLSIVLFNKQEWYWFPKTYCYRPEYDSILADFSVRLKSRYEYDRKKELFSNMSIESLKKHFEVMKEIKEDGNSRYRYPGCFDWADLILDTINIEDIGSMP